MSGSAGEEQTQPHLINSIIVLLQLTATPHHHFPDIFLLLLFFLPSVLFQALAACCLVARLSQSDTRHRPAETKHEAKSRRGSETNKTHATNQAATQMYPATTRAATTTVWGREIVKELTVCSAPSSTRLEQSKSASATSGTTRGRKFTDVTA